MVSILTDLEEELTHLRDLMAQGEVKAARALVKELEQRWPDAASVRHYARVLARPTPSMRAGAPGPAHDREHAWLRQHSHEHPGCWLAVLEDRLIAADADFAVVLSAVRATPDGERALLYFQPGTPD
jgi:hypothetical protein